MNPYFDQMILTASPVELIRMLYQRAIAKVREAREHLLEGRIAERTAAINLSYRVLTELSNSVDVEAAPDLGIRLKGLYTYMQGRLVEANLDQKDEPLADVLGLLLTMLEAWQATPDAETETVSANPWQVPAHGDETTRVVLTA